jgi:hypothetical protein
MKRKVPLRIHRRPQVVLLFFDRHRHLIEMPFVCHVWAFTTKLIGVLLSEFLTPFPNRFIRHLNARYSIIFSVSR